MSFANLRPKLFAGFSVPVILTTMLVGVIYSTLSALNESSRWVNHTHEAIDYSQDILTSLVNMETGLRGYLVAGDEEFLEPFHAGRSEFNRLVDEASAHVNDNPQQVERLQLISRLQDRWLEEHTLPAIELRGEVNKGLAADRHFQVVSARTVGKEKFDAFRVAISELESRLAAAQNSEGVALTRSILLDMVNQETGQRGFLLSGKEVSLEPFNAGRADFDIHVAELRRVIDRRASGNRNLHSLLDNVTANAKDWFEEAAMPEIEARREMNKVTETIVDVADFIAQGFGKKYMDEMRVVITDFASEEERLIVIRNEEAVALSDRTRTLALAGLFLLIVICVVITVWITSVVLKQLGAEPADIQTITEKLANGELDQLDNRSDATGVYAAVLQTANKLKEVVEGIQSSAEEVTIASGQVSQGNSNLSQRTQEQASTLEEVAASMEELMSTVSQNAENAQQASNFSNGAREQAEKGGSVAGEAVSAMEEISSASGQIADIIGVIDDIAFQTNLLALNAAVEAARAGDQGRGFAVVASEVRNLAGRSATAAKEIKGLIQNSVAKVDNGMRLVNESGDVLNDIVASVRKVNEAVSEIAAASREQTEGISQVNQSVTQMDEMTQENASLVEEAAAASETMGGQAEELKRLVSFFKLGQNNEGHQVAHLSQPQTASDQQSTSFSAQAAPKALGHVSGHADDDGEWKDF